MKTKRLKEILKLAGFKKVDTNCYKYVHIEITIDKISKILHIEFYNVAVKVICNYDAKNSEDIIQEVKIMQEKIKKVNVYALFELESLTEYIKGFQPITQQRF